MSQASLYIFSNKETIKLCDTESKFNMEIVRESGRWEMWESFSDC